MCVCVKYVFFPLNNPHSLFVPDEKNIYVFVPKKNYAQALSLCY